jgi:hypothetical protein
MHTNTCVFVTATTGLGIRDFETPSIGVLRWAFSIGLVENSDVSVSPSIQTTETGFL